MRKIFQDYIWNLSYQLLIIIFSLITVPYLSRILGPEKVGEFNYISALVSYFILFGNLGISMYGQREIGKYQNDIYQRSIKFYQIFIIRFIAMFIIFIIYLAMCFYLNKGMLYLLFSIQFLSAIFDVSWFFYGINQFKLIVFRNIFVRIIGLILIFLFVKNDGDLCAYIILNLVTTLLGNIFILPSLREYIIQIKNLKLTFFNELVPIFALFIPQLGTSIYEILDKVMLGGGSTNTEVGYYSQSQRIIVLLSTIISSLGLALFPKISNLVNNESKEAGISLIYKYISVIFMIGCPFVCGSIAIANIFIPIFLSNKFVGSIPIFQILSLLILLLNLQNAIGTQYMVNISMQKQYTKAIYCGACINLILNFLWIPTYQGIGSAYASIIAEIIVLIMMLFYVRNTFSINKLFIDNLIFIIPSILMLFIIYLLPKDISLFSLIINILVGGGFYLLSLVIFRKKIKLILYK